MVMCGIVTMLYRGKFITNLQLIPAEDLHQADEGNCGEGYALLLFAFIPLCQTWFITSLQDV